jgi:hypothetical protein
MATELNFTSQWKPNTSPEHHNKKPFQQTFASLRLRALATKTNNH